jgi:hypothetical protein
VANSDMNIALKAKWIVAFTFIVVYPPTTNVPVQSAAHRTSTCSVATVSEA